MVVGVIRDQTSRVQFTAAIGSRDPRKLAFSWGFF